MNRYQTPVPRVPDREPVVTPRGAARALTICAECPNGCTTFPIKDAWAAPDLNPGEQAVIDPGNNGLENGALYLVQWDSGGRSIRVARSREMQMVGGPDVRWWLTDAIVPETASALETMLSSGTLRANDAPYEPDHLQSKIVGRVVGVIPVKGEGEAEA